MVECEKARIVSITPILLESLAFEINKDRGEELVKVVTDERKYPYLRFRKGPVRFSTPQAGVVTIGMDWDKAIQAIAQHLR